MSRPTECTDCKGRKGRQLYNHLFEKHNYTKEMIEALRKGHEKVQCDICASWHASHEGLDRHKRRMHGDIVGTHYNVECPLCEANFQNHRQLAEHAGATHATSPGQYQVKFINFENKDEFEEWRGDIEENSVLKWVACDKRDQHDKVTYYRCSRALPRPHYNVKHGPRSKKATKYCTAFMQVTEDNGTFLVTYCADHAGHEKEPALLTLDQDYENLIVSLLKEGSGANQIVKKIRAALRDGGENCRLYYTTPRDIRSGHLVLQSYTLLLYDPK
ncbi:hypothetical protein GCK32_009236 [Trichostrongylus colubriformis]|uniref:C2H2-type domain-containing protein n=1 Tax=Trichostrongylus colubriformis TaxID=6319 RepID=A0AAN8FZ66_TRICO